MAAERSSRLGIMRDKYLDDYGRQEVYDPKTKKMRRVFVYTGPRYTLENPEKLKKAKPLLALAGLAGIGGWIMALGINGDATISHSWPLIADALYTIPMYLQLCAVVRLLLITPKKELRREDHDKTAPRLKNMAIAGMVLAAAAVLCHIIYGIIHGAVFGELWHYGANIIKAASSYILFRLYTAGSMKEIDEEGKN